MRWDYCRCLLYVDYSRTRHGLHVMDGARRRKLLLRQGYRARDIVGVQELLPRPMRSQLHSIDPLIEGELISNTRITATTCLSWPMRGPCGGR
jgi:hypothetical protein